MARPMPRPAPVTRATCPVSSALISLQSVQHAFRVLVIDLFEHLLGQVHAIDHPEALAMMTGGAVEILVVGFQETIVDPERLAIRRRVGAEHDTVLVLDEELSRRV